MENYEETKVWPTENERRVLDNKTSRGIKEYFRQYFPIFIVSSIECMCWYISQVFYLNLNVANF